MDAINLQSMNQSCDGTPLAEASPATRGKSTTKDVAEGWHPPPDQAPTATAEPEHAVSATSSRPPEPRSRLSYDEFNALQSKCPIELTPFGRLGKHAQRAVAAGIWYHQGKMSGEMVNSRPVPINQPL